MNCVRALAGQDEKSFKMLTKTFGQDVVTWGRLKYFTLHNVCAALKGGRGDRGEVGRHTILFD